jgi:hypothetical protein
MNKLPHHLHIWGVWSSGWFWISVLPYKVSIKLDSEPYPAVRLCMSSLLDLASSFLQETRCTQCKNLRVPSIDSYGNFNMGKRCQFNQPGAWKWLVLFYPLCIAIQNGLIPSGLLYGSLYAFLILKELITSTAPITTFSQSKPLLSYTSSVARHWQCSLLSHEVAFCNRSLIAKQAHRVRCPALSLWSWAVVKFNMVKRLIEKTVLWQVYQTYSYLG